jgi:hypothetical protein
VSNRTPKGWRRDDDWKHGGRPGDPLTVTPVDEERDTRIAKLVLAAIVFGCLVLVIREAIG